VFTNLVKFGLSVWVDSGQKFHSQTLHG